MEHLTSVANGLYAENSLAMEDKWIAEYDLTEGTFDIGDVDQELRLNENQNSRANPLVGSEY